MSGIEIAELRLPKDTVVSLIIRDATPFTPTARDRIKVGDELLIVTPTDQRDNTEERLGLRWRLARWRDGRTGPGWRRAGTAVPRESATRAGDDVLGEGPVPASRQDGRRASVPRAGRRSGVLTEIVVLAFLLKPP